MALVLDRTSVVFVLFLFESAVDDLSFRRVSKTCILITDINITLQALSFGKICPPE